jgi:hypothetical protein
MQRALTILPIAAGVGLEHVEDNPAPTEFESDPHAKRIALDAVEWCDRLARLAELREGGR